MIGNGVRHPAVAGLFYPSDPHSLATMVDSFLRAAPEPEPGRPAPVALIVPHAGYRYSGPVAATAYKRLESRPGELRRVVIAGPSHRVLLRGLAAPAASTFLTPLGPVPVDEQLRAAASRHRGVIVDDRPHAVEHSLEVQLPFLQRVLGTDGWTVLPLAVGEAAPRTVADVLESLLDDETLLVLSTDLSHYEPYAAAREHDARTAAAVLRKQPDAIGPTDACGAYPLNGLLELARRRDLDLELLDLRNSGDTEGDRYRVVGYGAFAVTRR
jgi:hypothetical protein